MIDASIIHAVADLIAGMEDFTARPGPEQYAGCSRPEHLHSAMHFKAEDAEGCVCSPWLTTCSCGHGD